MKKRGWMMGLLSGLAAVGATAGVIHGQTGTAQSGFLSDVFQYGNIPDTQNVTSAPVTLSGNEWKGTDGNIDITSVGMTEVNSSTISYGNQETAFYGARDFAREKSANYQLLSGKDSNWNLTVVPNMEAADKLGAFEQDSYQTQASDGWKSVELPASWTSYGFDYSIYTNTKMPFQENVEFPGVPVKNNPVGLYRKNFKVKDSISQDHGRIYITFGGVESAYYVYVNGKAVGYSEDSYNPHSFDITDYLNPKGQENLLAVKVMKFCDGTWMEDQDMIYDGGIFRDVYLTKKPNVRIADYIQTTDLAEDCKSGDLKLNISAENVGAGDSEEMGVEVTLYKEDGSVFLTETGEAGVVAAGKTAVVEKTIHVENPDLWDADHPNLYTMVLSLYGKSSGIHYESVSQNVGFRKLSFTSTQISNDGTYTNVTDHYETVKLNGKRLMIKGVNRHDTDPETGKYVSHEVYETDVKLMKKNNINAIRTSHYANDDYLYYLCDKYGMYLMCETNNESHAINNQEEKLSQLEKACMDRQRTAYARLKNVTANLMWSIGNESSGTINGALANGMFSKMVQYFKERDTTRMVHYEGLCNRTTTAGGVDMNSHMYYTPDAAKNGVESENHMPYLLCEYDHAMGNAVGNMKEYWDIIRSHDNFLGGFIWDWVDQSRKIPLSSASDWDYYATSGSHQSGLNQLAGFYLGYGGDWGDTINDGNFCQNGLVSADRDVQPEVKEVKYQYQDFWMTIDGENLTGKEIKIRNESLSKKLSEYELTWQLLEDDKVLSEGKIEEELLPQEEKAISVPYEMPTDKKAGAEYFLNLSVMTKEASGLLEKGEEVSYGQFKIGTETEKAIRKIDANGVKVTRGKNRYTFQGKEFSFVFNTTEGVIENYAYQGKVLMKKGPKPNFNRATLDNDFVDYSRIADTMKSMKISGTPAISQDAYGRFVVKFQWNGKEHTSGKDFSVIETMAVDGDGTVDFTFQYDFTNMGSTAWAALRKVGTILTLSEGQEHIAWYGNGDGESYCDRQTFTRVGKYQSTASEMFYPFAKPQDCGNLTGVRWMQVCDDAGRGMLFAAEDSMNASALHFTPEDMESAAHVKDLKASEDTYVTLDCAVAGTGNNSCGYRTLEQYRVTESQYTFHYAMKPMDQNSDAMALSKQYQKDVTVQAQQYTKILIVDETEEPGTGQNTPPAVNGTVTVNKVSGVKIKSGKKKLTVSWKKQKGCKYIVAYSTSKKKLGKLKAPQKKYAGVKKKTVSSNKAVLKKLKRGKVYYVKVAALKKSGGKTVYGKFSGVKKKRTSKK